MSRKKVKSIKSRRLNLEKLLKRELMAADAFADWVPGHDYEPTPLLGETVDVDLTFKNTGDQPGFAPFVDVLVPTGKGVDYVSGSASLVGNSLTEHVVSFNEDGLATHPFAVDSSGTPLVLTGDSGDKLVVLSMPFGSFAPEQDALEIDLQVTVDSDAEVGETLQLVTSGGFRYGNDALDNPLTDPSIVGASDQIDLTPSVIKLEEYYGGPEHETTSGPNFVRSMRIDIDVADGETLENISLASLLDDNLAYEGIQSSTLASDDYDIASEPAFGQAGENQSVSIVIPELTGQDGVDASFTINFHIPQHDALGEDVVSPVTGAGEVTVFDHTASADWLTTSNEDADDAIEITVREVQAATTAQISDLAVAVQQTSQIVENNGSSKLSVGDVIEYTLHFQVSDFVAVDNLMLNMEVPDGQTFLGADTTSFTISGVDIDRLGGAMRAEHTTLDSPAREGEEHVLFDVSSELAVRGGTRSLAGGLTTNGNGSGVFGTITMRAVVNDNFDYDFPSGDASLDEGDVMRSTVVASARMLDTESLTPSAHVASNNSAEWMILPTGKLSSQLHAVNGETDLLSNEVSAGDEVTIRIQRTVHGGDVEDFVINEFFPLPVFTIGERIEFAKSGDLSTGTISLGPSDTFHATHGHVPEITLNASSNQIRLDYGSLDWEESGDLEVDLLVTATVVDQPFADGLLLTAQAATQRGSTNFEDESQMSMDNIVYTRPTIELLKGVAKADNPSASLSGAAGDQNASKLDAGDRVMFEVTATNVGRSENGAHDLTLKDALPAGFKIPQDGINLTVTDGAGNMLDFDMVDENAGTDSWFAGGIRLTSPLTEGGNTDGSNVAIVRYELVAMDTVSPNDVLSSEAEVVHYASLPGGVNYATSRVADGASVAIASPSVVHTLIATDQEHTSGNAVVIGEKATYETQIQIPEGSLDDALIRFSLYRGLAVDEVIGIKISEGIELHDATVEDVLANAQIIDTSSNIYDQGRRLDLKLGDLTNVNRDNGQAEYITVQYTTTVVNADKNQTGRSRRPVAQFYWNDQSVSRVGSTVKVAEPALQITKSFDTTLVDAGDQLTVSLAIEHAGASNADAFDLDLRDAIPDGVTYVENSLRFADGTEPSELVGEGGQFKASWDSLTLGQTSMLEYDVIVNDDVHAGDSHSSTASVIWSSLAGDPGLLSANSDVAHERTGDTSDPGAALNDYRSSNSLNISIKEPTIDQKIVDSSFDKTTGNHLTIGETVTLEFIVAIPEGQHDLRVKETVSTETAILNVNSMRLISIGEHLVGNKLVIGASEIPTQGDNEVVFDLGTVTNTADGEETIADHLIFEVEALVADLVENQANDQISAVATIEYGSKSASDGNELTLVEPQLAAKSGFANEQLDAGEIVTVTTKISPDVLHGSTAIGVQFADLIADEHLTLVAGSVQTTAGKIATGNDAQDTTVVLDLDEVDRGDVVEISYQVHVSESANPGDYVGTKGQVSWSSLESGEHLRSYEIATKAQAKLNSVDLRGSVHADFEQDGHQDVGDFGIGEVEITLTGVDHLGNDVAVTTHTTPSGQYVFSGLRPGQYQLSQEQPENFDDGLEHAGEAGGLVENDVIKDIFIAKGTDGPIAGYDFTEEPLTWIEGTVYEDYDHNGILGQDENGIENVTIHLTGTTDDGDFVELETLTNERGYYVFEYLRSGTYSITQQQPDGFYDATESLGTAGGLVENDAFSSIDVDANTSGKMYNFGEFAPSTLQGSVFIDYDRDDLLDRKDGLIAGVAVTLSGVDYTGEAFKAETKTDVDGLYRFENLKPGTYDVKTEAIENLELGTVNIGRAGGWDMSGDNAGEAVDYGFTGITLTSGAFAEAYDVGHQDPEFVASRLEKVFPNRHVIKATSGDDQFNVTLSETSVLVEVGEDVYEFDNDEKRQVILLGSFGHDRAEVVGTVNKEVVNIRPTSAAVTGTWFRLLTYGMEEYSFSGGGYEDLVRFYDDTATETSSNLVTTPFSAEYSGEGWHNTVHDIHRIYVYSYNDGDTATMTGSERSDRFVANPDDAKMFDGDYYVYARGFEDVTAVANNKTDRAYMADSIGDDYMKASASEAVLQGDGYSIKVVDYDYVNVTAKAGGNDTSEFHGSAGYDSFVSRPTQAEMRTRGTRIIGQGFEVVDAYGNGGDTDRAFLFDSHYDDTLTASPDKTVLENAVNVVTANDFDRQYLYSKAGGNDVAHVSGSDGDDTFHAWPWTWKMYGAGYYMIGRGFSQVSAQGGEGVDKAYMYDSVGNDVYTVTPDKVTMQGRRYTNEASGFDKTYGYSNRGGYDRMAFFDSNDSRSTVRYNGDTATIFGRGYSQKAEGFDGVDAFYNNLASDDRVELSGNQSYEMTEVDLEGLTHKLSLLPNDGSSEEVDVRTSVDKL